MAVEATAWHCLRDSWDFLAKRAAERDAQKKSYASTRNWSAHSTHFLGLLGERVVELVTGLPMDLTLRAGGDAGRDFSYAGNRFEVRATQYAHDPHLKQRPDSKFWADYYILVAVDMPRRRGRIVGWATQAEVRAANQCNYGYGSMLVITPRDLRPGLPECLELASAADGGGHA